MGKIEYEILSEREIEVKVSCFLRKEEFQSRVSSNTLVVATDVSGSMYNTIDLVKSSLIKIATEYYKRENRYAPILVFFNDEAKVIEEKTLEPALRGIEVYCEADGGTSYAAPLQVVCNTINSRHVNDLHVIFLTDGEDGAAQETTKVADNLKA